MAGNKININRPQLFKVRITLSTGQISIRWIMPYILKSLICWIEIYQLDSIIRPYKTGPTVIFYKLNPLHPNISMHIHVHIHNNQDLPQLLIISFFLLTPKVLFGVDIVMRN